MNIIKTGTTCRVFGEDVECMASLPAKAYKVAFSKMSGCFLEELPDPVPFKGKIYGPTEDRVKRVLVKYGTTEGNFGVIMSGPKGSGKTLMAQKLAAAAIELGLPVVYVNENCPGLSDFIASIDQRAVVLFDEFDKAFVTNDERDCDVTAPQETLLTMLDGTMNGNKLFIVTVNNIYKMNDCLLNRPGRFRYHFRFTSVAPDEVRTYLDDKCLKSVPETEKDAVVRFSSSASLSYDILSAIVEEMNDGVPVAEALGYLNVVKLRGMDASAKAHVVLTDGSKTVALTVSGVSMDGMLSGVPDTDSHDLYDHSRAFRTADGTGIFDLGRLFITVSADTAFGIDLPSNLAEFTPLREAKEAGVRLVSVKLYPDKEADKLSFNLGGLYA